MGDELISAYLREALDTGDNFDVDLLISEQTPEASPIAVDIRFNQKFKPLGRQMAIHSACNMILLWIQSIISPSISTNITNMCLECSNFSEATRIIQKLPRDHFLIFAYIITFLKEISLNYTGKGLTSLLLCKAFGRVLFSGNFAPPSLNLGLKGSGAYGYISRLIGVGGERNDDVLIGKKANFLMLFLDPGNVLF